MGTVHALHNRQVESPPGTVLWFEGDLVEGRDWPEETPYSALEQNFWTVIAVTDMDIGDRLDPSNPWFTFWENNYVDLALLGAWAFEKQNRDHSVGPVGPGVAGMRRRVREVEQRVQALEERIGQLGGSELLLEVQWAIERFEPGDEGFRPEGFVIASLTWDELTAMGRARPFRDDLRPELAP